MLKISLYKNISASDVQNFCLEDLPSDCMIPEVRAVFGYGGMHRPGYCKAAAEARNELDFFFSENGYYRLCLVSIEFVPAVGKVRFSINVNPGHNKRYTIGEYDGTMA